MNWVVIAALIFLALCIFAGYQQGFLRVVYSLGKWILILLMLFWVNPFVSSFLNETKLRETIEQKIEARIEEKMEAAVLEQLEDKPIEQDEHSKNKEVERVAMRLPDSVMKKMPNASKWIAGELKESGAAADIAEEFTDLAITGISAVLLLLIVFLACHFIVMIFDLLDKLPGIKQINHGLGLVAGAVKGLLLIWIIFAVLATQTTTRAGQFMLPYIYEAPILQWIYENNFILTMLMAFF